MAQDHGYLYDLLRELGLSDFGASTGEFLLVRPLRIVLILLVAIIVSRLAGRAARRFVRSVHARSPLRSQSIRAEQRASTVGDALAGLVRVVIAGIAFLLVLDTLGINLAPLLAGAGIAGIAIGFGAQSLVRDFLAGLFILVEDQYGIGDVVTLGDTTGTVEEITLRITRIRSVDGTVWFLPNGEIRKVGNSSMEWSRALIDVTVAYDNDVAKVQQAIADEASTFAADPAWADFVLEEPEVLGVQGMGADGITIRLIVKTGPREQYPVARELRARISSRLRREGVRGPGQTVLVNAGPLEAPPPADRADD